MLKPGEVGVEAWLRVGVGVAVAAVVAEWHNIRCIHKVHNTGWGTALAP